MASDEELILLMRYGVEKARDVLLVRYYKKRRCACESANAAVYRVLDEWERNEAFFKGFQKAMENFRFQARVKFSSFVLACLKTALTDAADFKFATKNVCGVISLETPVSLSGSDDSLCIADCVQEGQNMDDPRLFYEYAEMVAQLKKLPRGIDERVIDIVRRLLEGYSIVEISEHFRLTPKQIEYELGKYRNWSSRVLARMKEGASH